MLTTLRLLMLDRIIIIDFEDSFTYNIASVLYPFEKSVVVISHDEFFKCHLEKFLNSKEAHALILGPGPGHPNEYQRYYLEIEKFRSLENFYVMGICLGHQILGLIDKKRVSKAQNQLHGQTKIIEFNNKKRAVQHYNSLALYEDGRELNVRNFDRGVSYQFHPESVGTESGLIYFRELLDFIHKKSS